MEVETCCLGYAVAEEEELREESLRRGCDDLKKFVCFGVAFIFGVALCLSLDLGHIV